jgi:hypothetical protein
LAVWEAWVCFSKKWRMPNLAGCDGCEAGGFLEAAAARFFGGMEISGLGCAYEI